MGKFYIGVDVGGTKIAYGLFDEGAKLIAKRACASAECPPEPFFDAIADGALSFAACGRPTSRELEGFGIVGATDGSMIRGAGGAA